MNNLRARIYKLTRYRGIRKSYKTLKWVGCTRDKLQSHLMLTAPKDFIWWDYNSCNFVVDHIIPISLYNLSVKENQLLCSNYRNLRIITKKNKLDNTLIEQYNIKDLLPISKFTKELNKIVMRMQGLQLNISRGLNERKQREQTAK